MGEAVHPQRQHRQLVTPSDRHRRHRLHRAVQGQAVGQIGFGVVHGQMGDAPLALADLRGHGVEAFRQPSELVAAGQLHRGVLAPAQPLGRLIQGRDRARHAAGQHPAAGHHQGDAHGAGQDDHRQHRRIGRHGPRHRIAEHQRRRRLAAQRLERLDQGQGVAGRAAEIPRLRRPRRQGGVDQGGEALGQSPGDRARRARRRRPAVHPVGPPQNGGVQGNGRQPLQRAHFARVQPRGEHHPPLQGRRQDRRGDGLVGRAADGQHAGRIVLLLHRLGDLGVGPLQRRGAHPRHAAVDADDEGHVDAQAHLEVLQGRADGGLVAAGDRLAEAEVARQQAGVALQLAGAPGPQLVEHRAGGHQFLPHHAAGVGRDRGVDHQGHQDQRQAEQAGVEHRQLGPQMPEHQYAPRRSGAARTSICTVSRPAADPTATSRAISLPAAFR